MESNEEKIRKEQGARLRQAREAFLGHDSTASDAATFMKVSRFSYIQHENGTRSYIKNWAQKYASAFGVSASWLAFGGAASQKRDAEQSAYGSIASDNVNDTAIKAPLKRVTITHRVPVLGVVEAGAWREMNDEYISEDTEFIDCELPEYKGVQAYCNRVSGTSVNKLVDHGGKVIWVSAEDAIGGLQEDDYVMVRRPNETPGQFEITVKRLHVRDDGDWELMPASTDQRWQSSYVIPPRNELAQEGIVVYGVVVETRQPKLRRSGIPARMKTGV